MLLLPGIVDFRVARNGETYPSLPTWLKAEEVVEYGANKNPVGTHVWLVGKVPAEGIGVDSLIININQPDGGNKGQWSRTQFQLTQGLERDDAGPYTDGTQVFAVRFKINKVTSGDFIKSFDL